MSSSTVEYTKFAVWTNTLPSKNLENIRAAMHQGGQTAVILARAVILPVTVLPDGIVRRNRLSYSAFQYNWKLYSNSIWEKSHDKQTEIIHTQNTVMEGGSIFSRKNRKKYAGVYFKVEHPSPFDIRHCLRVCVPRYRKVYSYENLMADLSLLRSPALRSGIGLFHSHCRCFLVPSTRNGKVLFDDEKSKEQFDHGDITARLVKVMETMANEVMPLLLHKACSDTLSGGYR